MWNTVPGANIGVATGASNLVVVDIDPKKDGFTSWKALNIPVNTLICKTGSGGAHLYFTAPEGDSLPNTAGKLGKGIDTRGNGGYVVAPPSVHPNGTPYTWYNDLPITQLPPQLLTLLRQPGGAGAAPDATILEGTRNEELSKVAGRLRAQGLSHDEGLIALLNANLKRCAPPLSKAEVTTIRDSAWKYPAGEHATDLGNARLLVALHGQDIAYCEAWKSWVVWDGVRWVKDDTREVERRAKDTARKLCMAAAQEQDDDRRKLKMRHALKSESRYSIQAMVDLARGEPNIIRRAEDFDTNQWLLNVLNGTIDLQTGKLGPHRREDLITKLAPVEFDPTAPREKWLAFLDKIMCSRTVMTDYLQKVVGYSLSGNTAEHVIFFLYGTGANGKSTFLEALRATMGGYAQVMSPETLTRNKGGAAGKARGDLVRLKGARLVTTCEMEEGKRLAEGVVKQMTGGDTMIARALYSSEVEFMPTHKIFLATNHKPVITGTDKAIWRRIHLIPFDVMIPEDERIRDYFDTVLRDELPGILAWAVQGCVTWQREGGLRPAEDVVVAVDEYKVDMDRIGAFLNDECVRAKDKRVRAGEVYAAYQDWCREGGMQPLNITRFGRKLTERGLQKERKGGKVWYLGFVLRLGLPTLGGM
jgi:putative DNA primase/helicase